MGKELKTPNETAEMLIEIYDASFEGKGRGRYLIEKVIVRQMSGRDILQKSTASKFIAAMSKLGYGMFIADDYFAIIKNNNVLKWRLVTSDITMRYLDDEDFDEDYDEDLEDSEDD